MRLSFDSKRATNSDSETGTPMIQSMEILQLPILALQERIEQEMNENPMLEVEERDEALPDEEPEEYLNPTRLERKTRKNWSLKTGNPTLRIRAVGQYGQRHARYL